MCVRAHARTCFKIRTWVKRFLSSVVAHASWLRCDVNGLCTLAMRPVYHYHWPSTDVPYSDDLVLRKPSVLLVRTCAVVCILHTGPY